MKVRQYIFNLLDEQDKKSRFGRAFEIVIVVLILLNVLAIILESFENLRVNYNREFRLFENFSVVVFTFEYLLRLYVSPLKYPGTTNFKASVKYVVSPIAIIDLLAILPSFLPLLIPIDLRFIRLLRLLRITRLFKLNRYSRSLQLMGSVIREKQTDLAITVFVASVILIFSSTLMYYVEGPVQPDAFPNVVASLWWAIATLTTVGYGDVVPVTTLGKIISGAIALLGVGLIALPTGILSSAFIGKVKDKRVKQNDFGFCPHCGKKVSDM